MFGFDIAMNQTCYALKAKDGCDFFLFCWFGDLVKRLVHAAHGSVFDTITTSTFQTTSVFIPPAHLRAAFETTVEPLFARIHANIIECSVLARLRDLLLPKLMSGEIRVEDAETAVKVMV